MAVLLVVVVFVVVSVVIAIVIVVAAVVTVVRICDGYSNLAAARSFISNISYESV